MRRMFHHICFNRLCLFFRFFQNRFLNRYLLLFRFFGNCPSSLIRMDPHALLYVPCRAFEISRQLLQRPTVPSPRALLHLLRSYIANIALINQVRPGFPQRLQAILMNSLSVMFLPPCTARHNCTHACPHCLDTRLSRDSTGSLASSEEYNCAKHPAAKNSAAFLYTSSLSGYL